MTAVALLLLISCVNVANLVLARASARTREVAIRSAVGAAIGQLARQSIIESTMLTFASAVGGIGLALAAVRLLLALAPPQIPRLGDVSIDLRVLLVAVSVSVVIAVVFGLAPLLHARRGNLQSTLRADKASANTGDDTGRHRRRALVATEVALAVALVTTAGLLLRSIGQLRGVDPGFDPSGVVKAEFQLPPSRYPVDVREFPNFRATHRFNDTLLMRLGALPGVEAVGLAGNQPLDVGFTNSFVIVGRENEAADWPEISIRRVTPGYFDALKVRVSSGRPFDDRDATNAPPVALINQAAVERFFAGRNPIGHEIAFWGVNRRIVGVVADERFHGIALAAPFAVYAPLSQTPSIDGTQALLVRANHDVRSSVRSIIRDLDPGLAVFAIEPLDETLANSIRQQQFLTQVLGLFAIVALVLAAVGIHGVLSYTLAQRTREIGVRIALGATVSDVMRLMVGQSLRVSVVGLVAGVALGLALSQSLRSWLYGVSIVDPATLLGVVVTLTSVAAVSSYVPTWRATRIDPATALRVD
jgi:predicted permease